MPYKFHDAHRHHIPKATYRVRNWQSYNAGLCQRGSVTLWLSADVTDGWKAPKRETQGGERIYSDGAIEAMLTMGAVYHLRLRQTQGFTKSLFDLLGLDLPARQCVDALPSAQGAVDRALGPGYVGTAGSCSG